MFSCFKIFSLRYQELGVSHMVARFVSVVVYLLQAHFFVMVVSLYLVRLPNLVVLGWLTH